MKSPRSTVAAIAASMSARASSCIGSRSTNGTPPALVADRSIPAVCPLSGDRTRLDRDVFARRLEDGSDEGVADPVAVALEPVEVGAAVGARPDRVELLRPLER